MIRHTVRNAAWKLEQALFSRGYTHLAHAVYSVSRLVWTRIKF